jgi:CheY-like chemotaxis protein
VDDDALSRRVVARVLQPAGFAIREASDGASGLASAFEHDPDLVLLDVDLPDISGVEVCRRLRSDPRTRSTPVAHLSAACIDVDWRVEGLEAGADAYLVLPVEPVELVATVRALLRLRRAEEDARRLVRQAKAIPRVREDALGAAAWELSGPVSALRIAAEGLLESLAPADSVARARIAAVVDGARNVDRALAALVELARADAGSLSLSRSSMSTGDAVAAARELAPGARVDLVGCEADSKLRCDPSRFRQMLAPVLGLVAGEGPRGRAGMSVAAEPGYLRFSVSCDGSPVTAEEREALFEPYWSRPRSRRRPDLEIALAKALVEAHGGQMWAAPSKGDAGLSVHFTLPVAEARSWEA